MDRQKYILVTGAGGQLGMELQQLAPLFPEYSFLFTRSDLPIENSRVVKHFFELQQIDVCINCAAYTAVDKAEVERDIAFMVNAEAVGNLAEICKQHRSMFIHISTDYVFDGSSKDAYREDHGISPLNVYGESKLKGEELALNHNPDAVIIRTSWLYSSFRHNFVKTMIRIMSERAVVNVVDDQYGCPTYAGDLAKVIVEIIEHQGLTGGIINYSNAGVASWYEFAIAIKEYTKSACTVNPVPSLQFPTPAKRPKYSVLDTTRIKELLGIEIPHWKDSLKECMKLLGYL